MTSWRSAARAASLAMRGLAGLVALGRLARVASTRPPVRATLTPTSSIDVVIPARDEATRIGPLLEALDGAPGVREVIVVDDQSSDTTAHRARQAGARVVRGRPLPNGWAGKVWALQQGIDASGADWIVTLDADTRPDPLLPVAMVARAIGDRTDLLTVGGRFDCPTPGSRWLHPSMLTTLVYRFGAPGTSPVPGREMANGQCMTFDRRRLLAAGGLGRVREEVVEDIALTRQLAAAGWRVDFLDASELLTVHMFETFGDTWRGWGRSLALPGVEPRRRQILDLGVIVLAQMLPLWRLLLRRGDAVDIALVLVRVGTLFGTRRAYTRGGTYWLSMLADPVAVIALAAGVFRGRRQTWRGRSYR